MDCVISKPLGLKVRQYAANFIGLNTVYGFITWGNTIGKIGVTELNKILLNNMANSWIKKSYVQGFYCESIT